MNGLLAGRRAVVTGGARGIGFAIATEFAHEGASVALADFCDADALDAAAAALVEAGSPQAFGMRGDVGDPAFAKEVASRAKELFGGVDILANNAGITDDGLLLRMSPESFERVVRTNLTGSFLMLKEMSALMIKERKGSIINISSVAGVKGNAGQANYSSSKAGVIGLTLTAAKELGSRGITVNAIAPGFVNTPMTAKLNDRQREESMKAIALGRAAEPEDIAHLAAFLASDKAAYITGQVICIDGGLVM